MNEDKLYRMIEEKEGMVALAFPALMRKVYVWMALALVITGITAFGIANNPGLAYTIVTNRLLFWGLVIAEFGLVVAISGAINRLSITTATLLFILYSVINGATLSVIFLAYTLTSIANVFFITAGTFGVMAFLGYTTKKDLTSLGRTHRHHHRHDSKPVLGQFDAQHDSELRGCSGIRGPHGIRLPENQVHAL